MERKLAAILYADVAGYSRLTSTDEVGTHQLLKRHLGALTETISQHGGRICHFAGDAVLADFSSVVAAVTCAVAAQRELAERNKDLPEERRLEFRIGVNLGDVMVDGEEIYGNGVNVAARLESLADAGGICTSGQVVEQVKDHVDVGFTSLGPQTVKNIETPVNVHKVLLDPEDAGKAVGVRPQRRRSWRWPAVAVALLILAAGAGALWLRPGPPGSEPPSTDKAAFHLPDTPSIAVLPLINLSGDESQEYFSDGLTEDIIAALGRFPSLTVMARNAVFPYKGKNAKPDQIGRELSVRYLVEGSVRRAGQRIRVNAQLTEAMSGKLLWSQQYDEDLEDVFAVQDAITRDVAGTLAVKLTRVEQQRALAKPTENLDAYDLMLHGRERLWLSTRTANREARQFFERAIQMDPNYAAAYAWLGRAYQEVANLGWTEYPGEAADRALALGTKAVSLDPDNIDGLSVIASAHALRTEYDQALAASDRLLAINPSDAGVLLGRLAVLLWLGRIDEAIEAGETGFRFDPNPRAETVVFLGLAYYEAHRHADAVRVLERGAARFPEYSYIYAVLAAAYAQMDRMPEAAQALATFRRLNPFFDVQTFGSRFRNPAHQAYLREGVVKAGWN